MNPLADKFRASSGEIIKEWSNLPFRNADLDVVLDFGCAKAKYLRQLASINTNINYLGVEIREEVANYVNSKAKDENVDKNLFVIGGYAAETLLPDISRASNEANICIRALNILHPDPWIKKKHLKRRIVNVDFVKLLETYLPRGTAILLQTDVKDLHEYHREIFEENSVRYLFSDTKEHTDPHFELYMGDVLTDRHRAVMNNEGSIYRAVLLEQESLGTDSKTRIEK